MKYAFDGDLKNPRELEGEVIGGNVVGRDPKALAKEFNVSRAVRPDVKNAVWHNSLRLPEGDQVSKETWSKIGDRYMEKMGFSEAHQRVFVLHDDKAGQHIHVVASRVSLDGKLFLGKNENLKSTRVIAELEKEFNLTITKGVSYDEAGKIVMPEKSKASKNEMDKALRTGVEPPRVQLQKLLDQALTDKQTSVTQFVERLQSAGVEVVPNIASTGKLNGFKFGLDGVFFSGSKLGDNYKLSKLQSRGLTYDKERESGFLKQLSAEAGVGAEHGRPAENARAPGSRADRELDPRVEGRDQGVDENLRGVAGRGNGRVERGPDADDRERPGRGERIDGIDRESRSTAHEIDHRAEAGDPGVEQPGGAEKRPSTNDHNRAAKPDIARDVGSAAEISSGIEITSGDFIRTGNKGSDELLSASHKNRLKGERERMAAGRKRWADHGDSVKNSLAAMRRPYAAQLTRFADMGRDAAGYRAAEIGQFAKALGAERFQVVCTSADPKEKPITRVFTAEQLQNPATIKSMSTMSGRRYDVSITPDLAAGVILVKGLDADGIKKLEATGFQPAAVIDVAGKKQAWIATGSTMSADERKALTKRLERVVGVEQKHNGSGGLAGFSSGQKAVSLTACPGAVAPAAAEHLVEIKASIFEAKAARRLELAIEKEVVVKAQDFDSVGGIKSLRNGWLKDRCHAAEAEATFLGGKYDPAVVERGVVASMARQDVSASQAYRAVFNESRVCAGKDLEAAHLVTETYARVALEKEGRSLDGVDLQAEARKRYPDLLKHAERGTDSELKREAAERARGADLEQQQLDAEAERKRAQIALERANQAKSLPENTLG